MGWKEAEQRYQRGETLTDQKAEDFVARRVLRGLSLVQRQLPTVERKLFGTVDFDEAQWPRTKAVLQQALINSGHAGLVKQWVVDALSVTGKHKDVLDRWEMLADYDEERCETEFPVILARAGNIGIAYSAVAHSWHGLPSWLRPRYTALAIIGGYTIIVQDLEHFISQFGPFEWGLE